MLQPIPAGINDLTPYPSTGCSIILSLTEMSLSMSQNKLDRWPLIGGAAAAVAASLCCIGPLVLVMLGIGGAWAANLSLLEPYRPLLLGVAVVFLVLAWRKIYAASCMPGTLCALPQTNRVYKVLFWLVAALICLALLFPYFAPLFY